MRPDVDHVIADHGWSPTTWDRLWERVDKTVTVRENNVRGIGPDLLRNDETCRRDMARHRRRNHSEGRS